MELNPNDIFLGDVPDTLVHEYVHWLDLDRNEIEFRQLKTAWKSSPKHWKLSLGDLRREKAQKWRGAVSQMIDEPNLFRLIDIHSECFRMISRQFERLEDWRHIIVTRCSTPSAEFRFDIHLPRYRLKFLVNHGGDLESVNFPGYCVTHTQSVGTLFGLFNRLVLEASTTTILPQQRVFIPLGTVGYSRKETHVNVTIDVGSSRHVRFYDYRVRTDLGFLEGDGSLGSHFYQAYLHALTSHCLQDPLTGRTGTEECLYMLKSSRSFSIQNLYDDGFSYLPLIHSLTPRREFYPKHLRVMQMVYWSNNLPIWTQHPLLALETASILDYCQKLQKLQCEEEIPSFLQNPITHNPTELAVRDLQRNSRFYVGLDIESKWSHSLSDTVYLARDAEPQKELIVCKTASSVFQPLTNINLNLWNVLGLCDQLYVSELKLSLSYSLDWLTEAVPFSYYMSLFNLCRSPSESLLKKAYKLLFSLAAMAYKHSDSQRCRQLVSIMVHIIHNPVLFGQVPRPFPTTSPYRLTDGFQPDSRRLQEILNSVVSRDQKREGEKKKAFKKRQETCRSAIPKITRAILSQWPAATIQTVDASGIDLFPNTMWQPIRDLFHSCYRNCELSPHINAAQNILDRISSSTTPPYSGRDHEYKFGHSPPRPNRSVKLLYSGIHQLLSRTALKLESFRFTSLDDLLDSSQSSQGLSKGIQSMISQLRSSSHGIQRLFGDELRDSCRALLLLRTQSFNVKGIRNLDKVLELLSGYVLSSQDSFLQAWMAVYNVLSPESESEKILFRSGLWPSLTPHSLLNLLAHDQRIRITPQWR